MKNLVAIRLINDFFRKVFLTKIKWPKFKQMVWDMFPEKKMKIQYFKAAKCTNRWNKNQKVWIRFAHANHLTIWFKFRGSGRYVEGIVDRFAFCVGEIKDIEVGEDFGHRIRGRNF